MWKNSSDAARSALSRVLIACRDQAAALAARALDVGASQRNKGPSGHEALFCSMALRDDNSDEVALEVWADDGGHSGTSKVNERYKASRRGGTAARASLSYRCFPRSRGPGTRIDESSLTPARDCELNACWAFKQEARCLTI